MAEREYVHRVTVDDQASRPLQEISQQEQQVADQVERSGRQADQAGQQASGRAQQVQRLQQRLQDLQRAEREHQQRLQRGEQITQNDVRASQQRQQQIRRLDTALTRQQRTQQAATQDTRRFSQETMAASASAGEMSRATGGLGATLGRLTGSVRGMVTSWLGFTAIIGTIVTGLREIGRESEEALQRLIALGNELRHLSVNLGENADEILRHANTIADTEDQRNALIEFATTMTDHRPELAADPARLAQLMERVAPLQPITGERGETIAETVLSLADAGFERPEDAAAMFMTGALDARDIQQLLLRGGREGLELTEAMVRTGRVDPRRASRQLPRIFGALQDEDEAGRVTEDLQSIGITDDMDTADRVRQLVRAAQGEDAQRRGVARDIIGADRMQEMVPAMAAALREGGALQDVRRDLDEVTAADLHAQQRESEVFERAFEQEQLAFRKAQREESEERASFALRRERARDRLQRNLLAEDRSPAARLFATGATETMMFFGVDPDTIVADPEPPAGAGEAEPTPRADATPSGRPAVSRAASAGPGVPPAPTVIHNHNNNQRVVNIGTQFNNAGDPRTEDLD